MDRDSINKHFITAKRLSTFVKDGALPIQDAAQKLYDTTLEISSANKGNNPHYEFMIALVSASMAAMARQIDKASMFDRLLFRRANKLFFDICTLTLKLIESNK